MSIVLNNINKSYGTQHIVRDVSLEIESGELFVLLGASGSGKSTLLRLIAGLIQPDSGRILLNERDVTRLTPQQRGTGFVFQNYSLFRHMTVAQNIEFGLSIRRTNRAERTRRSNELLELIDLSGYGDRLPSQLSGGQQQRVALARALAYQPNVLLLDEPFGALDVKIRAQLRQSLRDIQQRLGVTAILVTHDQEEAFDIADRIGVIEGGRLLEVGTPTELYRRPQNLFTATFLGTANLLHGQRNGTHVHLGEHSLTVPPNTDHLSGQDVAVIARPEQIELSLSAEGLTGEIIGRGVIERIEFAGAIERITLRMTSPTNEPIQALLTAAEVEAMGLTTGQSVWLGLKQFHLVASPNTASS